MIDSDQCVTSCTKSTSRCRPEVVVGDIEILKGDLMNQMFWKLAKVEELLPR